MDKITDTIDWKDTDPVQEPLVQPEQVSETTVDQYKQEKKQIQKEAIEQQSVKLNQSTQSAFSSPQQNQVPITRHRSLPPSLTTFPSTNYTSGSSYRGSGSTGFNHFDATGIIGMLIGFLVVGVIGIYIGNQMIAAAAISTSTSALADTQTNVS